MQTSATSKTGRLLACCAALAHLSELLFVLLFAGLSIALSAAIDFGITRLGVQQTSRPELLAHGVLAFILIAIVFGPLLETLLLQHFPVLVAKRFGASVGLQYAIGAVPFAALHFQSGIVTGVAAGIAGGAVFSLAYLTFLPQSKTKAFWATAAIHALHNFVPAVMYVSELP